MYSVQCILIHPTAKLASALGLPPKYPCTVQRGTVEFSAGYFSYAIRVMKSNKKKQIGHHALTQLKLS